MELTKVKYNEKAHVGYIQMCCEKNLNAIDEVMAEELLYVLDKYENNDDVRVIVISAGNKVFSSGGDINYFYDFIQRGIEIDLAKLEDLVGKLAYAIRFSKKIIISAVKGAAAGSGANLALNADFVFCTENGSFIQAFSRLGLAPDTGGGYILAKKVGIQKAMRYCVLAEPITAEMALADGLIYCIVPLEQFDKELETFAEKLAMGPYISYKMIKNEINAAVYSDYFEFLDRVERSAQITCSKTEDFREGIKAFIEKRKPVFEGK